jgi:hypothetical protein
MVGEVGLFRYLLLSLMENPGFPPERVTGISPTFPTFPTRPAATLGRSLTWTTRPCQRQLEHRDCFPR